MIPFGQIILTVLEAVGEACGKKTPKTADELKRQRIQRRNERAMMFFCIFCLIFSVVLFCWMKLK